MNKLMLSCAITTAIALSACTVGPDFKAPEVDLPKRFQTKNENPEHSPEKSPEQSPEKNNQTAESQALLGWKNIYQDPYLIHLIDTAIKQNYDLRIAISRLKEARALANIADASFYPSIGLMVESERVSEEGGDSLDNNHQLKGELAWDVDLFGYNRRASEAAWAELTALGHARNVVEMNLVAEVASTYFSLKDFDEKIRLSEDTVVLRERAFNIAKLRKKNGVISGLDVKQAEVELETAKVILPRLALQRTETLNRLKLLLADESSEVTGGLALTEQTMAIEIPVGIPSEVLLRRPDVLQVQAELHSATAQVGMATANLLPKITLTSDFGFESAELSNLLSGDSVYWDVIGGLTQPLFNAGKLRNDLSASEQRAYQATLSYKKIVTNAFLEVSNQLTALKSSGTVFLAQQKLLEASEEYERLANLRYRNGVASSLDLMDAQRKLFDAQLAFSSARKERLVAFVNLYRALGGGWDNAPVGAEIID